MLFLFFDGPSGFPLLSEVVSGVPVVCQNPVLPPSLCRWDVCFRVSWFSAGCTLHWFSLPDSIVSRRHDLMALNVSESTQDEIRMQLKIVIILIRDGKIYIQE